MTYAAQTQVPISRTKTDIEELLAKVLVPMVPPKGTEHRRLLPLLFYWQPIGPKYHSMRQDQVKGGHLFKVTGVTYNFGFPKPQSWKINPKFGELGVFSISSYLRCIGNEISGLLDLPMPNASKKMRALLRVAQVPLQTD